MRPARPGDAPALARILSDWVDQTPWLPRVHSPAEDRLNMAELIGAMEVTLACRRRLLRPGLVLGFLARRDHAIHALYIGAGARRQGIGRALLDAAKQASPRLELWCFAANLPARAFYRSAGFHEVEAGTGAGNDEGLPDLRLEWSRT